MGQRVFLEGAQFTSPKFPIIRDDKSLNAGSLFMLDPSHTLSQLSGVPVDSQQLYNVAWKEAKGLIGSGDSDTLRGTFKNGLGAHGLFERSAKGGLHGIVSQTTKINQNAKILLPSAVLDYLTANPSRNYAVFFWSRLTRVRTTNDVREYLIAGTPDPLQNNLINGWFANQLGAQRVSINKPTGWVGTPVGRTLQVGVPAWGSPDSYTHINQKASSSFILYRVHIIDVAASGKTFAQLEAEDVALYDSMFAEGGKFYDDTFASPAVLP